MAYFNTTVDSLPALDAESQQHAERVQTFLRELIESHGGFIGFDRYMEAVLYEPGLGYYSAGSEKFGSSGDYVTAPLISPFFSQTVAHYIAGRLIAGDAILELGAGTGVMAADMLAYLGAADALPSNYYILEPGADLRQRQLSTLTRLVPELVERVSWLDCLPSRESFSGVIIGNEVVDAMPVKRFVLQSGEIQELGVGFCDGHPCWKTSSADGIFKQTVLSCLPLSLESYPDGYCSEYRPVINSWLGALHECMESGMVMLLDYGYERSTYYAAARTNGTIRGYYRHYMLEDPFKFPGMVDLTASVDFTELAESAVQHGFQVSGYTSQANFLMDSGLLERVSAQQDLDAHVGTPGYLSQAEAIKCLTDPGEMGESIKVIILDKGREIDAQFSRDQRYRL